MASWRPIDGHIDVLDPDLTSFEDVEEFLAHERILGRGKRDGDVRLELELAVTGRRRRVATLDDQGVVIPGMSVNELLEAFENKYRKLAVNIGGSVLHGPIDLGEVDVDDYDPELHSVQTADSVPSDDDAATDASDVAGEAEQIVVGNPVSERVPDPNGVEGDALPEACDGPTLIIADLAKSEIPPLARAEGRDVAVMKSGENLVLVCEGQIDLSRKIFPRPNHVLALCVDKDSDRNPQLIVRRDNFRTTWDWTGELPPLEWTDGDEVAQEFIADELGAGAVARQAVADVVDAGFVEVRNALLMEPELGVAALVAALGLPAEATDVLEGTGSIRALPDGVVIGPGSAPQTFEQTLAFEIAGEGVVDEGLAKAYRSLYLKRPWAVSAVAVVQAGIGGVVLANSMKSLGNARFGKIGMLVGGTLMGNALSRILTTQYVKSVVRRTGVDIPEWDDADYEPAFGGKRV